MLTRRLNRVIYLMVVILLVLCVLVRGKIVVISNNIIVDIVDFVDIVDNDIFLSLCSLIGIFT